MTPTVLVLNCGSSSIKYELIAPSDGAHLASGIVERIGESSATIRHAYDGDTTERSAAIADHQAAMQTVLSMFDERGPRLSDAGIVAVGHRVVMGGDLDAAVVIDDDVLATIERCAPLAPLHNPANLVGIRVAGDLLADVPQIAVFDTAFFRDLPPAAATYALDSDVAHAHSIRRYGFHGTSHQYVSGQVAELVGRNDLRQIVLHLGNGASASAVVGHVAVEISMGLTPLEGLVMGTRTGDIDAAVVLHLARTAGLSIDEIDELLNRKSGLKGLSGHNDMREVHRLIAAGNSAARLALDVYVHRLKKYVGGYAAIMGGLDVLTFTAGVGENDPVVRAAATAGLGFLGIEVDPARNEQQSDRARRISPDSAQVTVLVIPTDEELAIARQAAALAAPP